MREILNRIWLFGANFSPVARVIALTLVLAALALAAGAPESWGGCGC